MESENSVILDIGCGETKVPGSIGLDRVPLKAVDVVGHIQHLPFRKNVADEIHVYHVLEHLPEQLAFMDALWEISKPKARLFIRVPHYSGWTAWVDPTHIRTFSLGSFDYYGQNRFGYYSKARYKVVKTRLKWLMSWPNSKWYEQAQIRPVSLKPWMKPIVWMVQGLMDMSPNLCERLWVYWIGGAEEIEVELEACK